MTARRLAPAMALPSPSVPVDAAAVWVGLLDVAADGSWDDELAAGVSLADGSQFASARLLVRQAGAVRGFIDVPVASGHISGEGLRAAAGRLPPLHRARPVPTGEPVSVVLCSRDRAEDLRCCLATLLAVDYPDYEIIVVDSASATTATRDVVDSLGPGRVRYVRLEQPGLSRARNAGVRAAAHELIAFTDDDVVVDADWLSAISAGFASEPAVVCVTGIVASGQLVSRAQRSIDRQLTWARNFDVTRFCLADPPAAFPLFPFQFGAYGTGANFAARRSVLLELGGFDEALGAGTLTRGCEDLDLFTRVVLAGHTLLYQPDAVVWHKHRVSDAAMATQLEDFRVSLGALLTKLAGDPITRRAMLPVLARGARHLATMVRPTRSADDVDTSPRSMLRELRAIARGPLALRRARRTGPATPLHEPDRR